MKNPTVIFFGNTKYSTIGLQIVQKSFPLSLLVTIPSSPVKQLVEKLNVPILETDKLDQPVLEKISSLKPDFLIVEDYGLILPEHLLAIPKYAALNIHHSLLPKYRGPSPAPTAILNGDKVSGVSIIKMTEKVDAGPILAQQEYTLKENETTESLLTKLNQLGGELLIKILPDLVEGGIVPKEQDNAIASYCNRITKQDGYFEIDNPPSPEILDRMIRAYYPWPTVWTLFRQGSKGQAKIVKFLPGGKVQMEGKKPINFKDFLNGYPSFPLRLG